MMAKICHKLIRMLQRKKSLLICLNATGRLHTMKAEVENSGHKQTVFQMLNLVLRNVATALKQPELFESQRHFTFYPWTQHD